MMKLKQVLNLSLSSVVWALLPLLPLSGINSSEAQASEETMIGEQTSKKDIENLITLGNNLYASGKYKEASIILEKIVDGLEARTDSSAEDIAQSLNNLAVLYYKQSLYDKSELLYQRAIAISERTLGPEHPKTAISMNYLALLYYNQGLYNKAEPLYHRALTIGEKALGPDHPKTSEILGNLALLYKMQGLYSKAKPLFKRALAIDEKVLGLAHPNTAISINNLANLYTTQGLYSKAEPLFKRALAIQESALGPEHPDLFANLNNVAFLYSSQGLYDKAEPLYQRAIAISERALGPNHPNTATGVNNLALLYEDKGLYRKARSMYQRALAIREKILGPDHPNTAASLNNLAFLYKSQGLYSKADSLFLRALAINERALGLAHPSTATSLNNLASLYTEQGLYSKAEPIFKRSLAIFESALGPEHPSTGIALNNLAGLYDDQGSYSKAEPLYQRALAIDEKVLGLAHPNTATSLNNLANLYTTQGLYRKAKPLFKRALAIYESALGPEHPSTALSLNNLAFFYTSQGLYSNAEPLFQRALAIKEKTLGPDHPDTSISLSNLGSLYSRRNMHNKAEPLLRRSLTSQITIIRRETPFLAIEKRQVFMRTFQDIYGRSLSFSSISSILANLSLYGRLNLQGLLEEIEKKQAQLASLPGEQQDVAKELSSLNQQLSSLTLRPEKRQALKIRQERLEEELYRLLPELEPRIVEVEHVADMLPSNGVLIEFQRYQPFDSKKHLTESKGKPRYLAMVLKPDATVSVIDLGDAETLERAIAIAINTSKEAQVDALGRLKQVSKLVIDPLNRAIAGSKTLFISPDSELNRLPFAALQAPDKRGYLAEVFDLRLLTTGRELLDLKKPSKPAKSAALVVADPDYDRGDSGVVAPKAAKNQILSSDERQRSSDLSEELKWKPLAATAKEGERIASLTSGSLLMQEKATAEAVKRTPAPKVLHLATHAFYLPNQPEQQLSGDRTNFSDQRRSGGVVQTSTLRRESPLLRSGVAMAGANHPKANPNDDGYLTALEVAQLDLEGTDLMVISACESGLGDIQTGEGIYGLKRAIAIAGARSSLLSLWKVNDDATKTFMENFYQRLKEGKGKADALAETQKQFRQSPVKADYDHPYYWAAFQLSGDWGPVDGL